MLVRARDVGRTVGAKFMLTRSAEAFAKESREIWNRERGISSPEKKIKTRQRRFRLFLVNGREMRAQRPALIGGPLCAAAVLSLMAAPISAGAVASLASGVSGRQFGIDRLLCERP